MTRQDHMEWCKKRALEYIDMGDLQSAFGSMASDLRKHPETANHIGVSLGLGLMMAGKLSSADEMRKFIDGFN